VIDLGNEMNHYEALHQVTTPLFLIPAYGRRYRSREAALRDWLAGKDFQILGGPYCSIRDLDHMRQEYARMYIQYESGTVEV
jgi:hypothetical protein